MNPGQKLFQTFFLFESKFVPVTLSWKINQTKKQKDLYFPTLFNIP